MKKFAKKLFATLLSISILGSSLVLTASAEIPHAYWQYQTPFAEAKASGVAADIITASLNVESVMIDQPLAEDVAGILYNTYSALSPAYESLGDYDSARLYLEKLIPYAEYLGFDDAVQIATRRLDVIDPMTQVYALTDTPLQATYFGAMYEPEMGTYYGRVYAESGIAPTETETAISVYVEFLNEDISDFDYFISPIDDGEHILHVALNMPNENADLGKVLTADSYINETMTYLAGLESPVFLRIGGEMNVWTDLADPDAFKAAYIKIAQAARTLAPNVALVFSPNLISEWNTDIDDYYPGDEYVDWVGISSYSNMYRNGYTYTTEDFNEMYYNAGIYANYVTSMKHIVDLYGDRKPIMFTESGTGHTTASGEDLTQFASTHVEQLFTYVNMVYPQVKALIYFEADLDSSGYSYALSSNDTVYATYLEATSTNPTLLHDLDSGSLTYVTADQYSDDRAILSLASYCNPVGDPTVTVTYTLDGTTIKTTTEVPYNCDLTVANLGQGSHSLTVSFQTTVGYTSTLDYTLTKLEDGTVTITSDTGITQEEAAQALYEAEIWSGMGTNADGSIDFGLEQVCTREQIVKLLISLLGQEELVTDEYATMHNFTDVSDWASKYVGYAYVNGLASGTSDTTFGGGSTNTTVAQCLTFVLRGLGYSSSTDFAWDSPWTLSDAIGLTSGQYTVATDSITRGDLAVILYMATQLQ